MAEIKLSVATQRINAAVLSPVAYNRVRLAILAGHLRATKRIGLWWVSEDELWPAIEYFAQATDLRRTRS